MDEQKGDKMKKKIGAFLAACMVLSGTNIVWAESDTVSLDVENYKIEGTGTITEETASDPATAAFENYLKENHIGEYYAIVDAGENQEKILIVTDKFSEESVSCIIGEICVITAYAYRQGEIRQLGEPIPQGMPLGPWYFHENKLKAFGTSGGYYSIDFSGDSNRPIFHDGVSEIWTQGGVNWEEVAFIKNRGSEEKPVKSMQDAYRDAIQESEEKYGVFNLVQVNDCQYPNGVCYLELRDMNGDNVQELLVVRLREGSSPSAESGWGDYMYDVWTYRDGEAITLETDTLYFASNEGPQVRWTQKDGKPYLVTSSWDFNSTLIHGFRENGSFGVVDVLGSAPSEDGTHTYLNGVEIGQDEWHTLYSQYMENVEGIPLYFADSEQAAAVSQKIADVKNSLGINAAESEQSAKAEETSQPVEGSALKQQAVAEVEALEEKTEELEYYKEYESMGQVDFNTVTGEIYELWDDQLNKIWSYLLETLPSDEMEVLRQEELAWIADKEAQAKEAGSEYAYGSNVQMLAMVTTETELTKERVYVLLDRLP